MTPQLIKKQLDEIFSRLIRASISVQQFYPKYEGLIGGGVSIGSLPLGSISLRDIPYQDVYTEIEKNDSYHIKLPDGGLVIFQYMFDGKEKLIKHRLCYFPCYILPTIEEAPGLYENDELYGDVILNKIIRFPIRFDYDPSAHRDVEHPASHLTLGQYENCRIPVDGPVSPNTFLMFILRNFYYRSYRRNKNQLDKKLHHVPKISTLTSAEQLISHFMSGR